MNDDQHPLLRYWPFWVILTASFALGIAITAGLFRFSEKVTKNDTTRQALCAFKHDRERRLIRSTAFMRAHPHGIPGLVTIQDLQDDVDQQAATLRALSKLEC